MSWIKVTRMKKPDGAFDTVVNTAYIKALREVDISDYGKCVMLDIDLDDAKVMYVKGTFDEIYRLINPSS